MVFGQTAVSTHKKIAFANIKHNKMKTERGIILSPKIKNNIPIPFYMGNLRGCQVGKINNMEESNSIELLIKEEHIKNYLFYWDKIAIPKIFHNNEYCFAPMMENESIKTLLTEKKLSIDISYNVTTIPTDKQAIVNLTNVFSDSQIRLYKVLNEQTDDRWCIGQLGNEIISSSFKNSSNMELVEIMLYNSLPLPHPNTHIDDILNFKQKRLDELYNLRFAIDELKDNIKNSSNTVDEFKKSIEKIQQRIIVLDKVMYENKIHKIYKNLNLFISLNEQTIIPALSTLGGVISGQELSLPLALLTAYSIQGVLSILSHKFNIEVPKEYDDFIYLFNAKKQKLI